MGVAQPPVRHFGYVLPRDRRAYGRHEKDTGTQPGAHRCGICDRWVVRGMGRWWEEGGVMDPDENLAEQRRLVEELHHGDLIDPDAADAGRRLADLVKALDEWLARGGWLPEAWTLGR